MNALTTPVKTASATLEQMTDHLTILTNASAHSQQLLAKSQSLREVAADNLRTRFNTVHWAVALPVSNPDAIFFNHRDASGALSSMAVTDLLIHAVRQLENDITATGDGFYTRHDSVDQIHTLNDAQTDAIWESIRKLKSGLVHTFEGRLQRLWRTRTAHPGDPLKTDTTEKLLIGLHRSALQSEIALGGLFNTFSPEEQTLLSAVIEHDSIKGVFELSWLNARKMKVGMPGAYVVSQAVQEDDQPSGVVFLIIPCKGIERFASIDDLRETLRQRLTAPTIDAHLLECMSLSNQGRLTNGESVGKEAWRFAAINRPLLGLYMQSVQDKQMEDSNFLMQQPELDTATFHSSLGRVQVCAHIDDGMGYRFNDLWTRMDVFSQPDWRKYADDSKKQQLEELKRQHQTLQRDLALRLQGTESLDAFASREITHYIQQHLGCSIDSTKVQITLKHTIDLGSDDPLKVTLERSLFEFAVLGMPRVTGRIEISPAPKELHAQFSEGFVKRMIAELNLRYRYSLALRECYDDKNNLLIMAHHCDSAIALSAHAAVMQGHMRDDRSEQLLNLIRGDKAKAGSTYSIGSLYLSETNTRFNDLIVFQEETQGDKHFVLYAPGAPVGKDFFEFGSWRQLSFEVGGWLASESGRSYVHDQLTGPTEGGYADVIESAYLKPSLWGEQSCLMVPCTGTKFEQNMVDLVRQKVARSVAAVKMTTPQLNDEGDDASLATLAEMEAGIEAINTEFSRLTPKLIDFRGYVHQQTSSLLNTFLRSQGYTRYVDPDTLYLGLSQPYALTPDFSEHTPLHQLTGLMMDGRMDILEHRPDIHIYSSTGLDVEKLPKTLIQFMDNQIRGADMGTNYMDMLHNEFLGSDGPLYERRKKLMAKRIQFEMRSGALKEYLKGSFHQAQHAWVSSTIAGLSQNASATTSGSDSTSSVSAFKIANQVIEGVYIFRDSSNSAPTLNLLYTPDAPDGVYFRHLTDYARLLKTPMMQRYYAGRVAYQGQRLVNAYIDELLRGEKYGEDDIKIVNRSEDQINNAERLYVDMFGRMIEDVDAQTQSVAEYRVGLAWTIIKWTGTLLLLPFPTASFAWGVMTTSVSFYEAYLAYAAGERADALIPYAMGVFGLISGGDSLRALLSGAHTVLKSVGLKAGVWALNKLELGRTFHVVA